MGFCSTRRGHRRAVGECFSSVCSAGLPGRVNSRRWWRFRIPGQGSVDWKGFFAVLAEVGYAGAMNIENEDEFYYPAYNQANFTEQYKRGFHVAHEFLKTLVPPVTA